MFAQSIQMLTRRLSKDGLFSFINLTNLIVGFATFILLSQFIQGMLGFDKHNEHYDRTYRLQLHMDQQANSIKHTWSVPAALGRQNLAGLPEIEKITLLHDVGDNNKSGVFLSVDKKNQFLTRFGYYADQTVFDIFTFNFLEGDPGQALNQPFSIVLSKTLADKLFPLGKPLGQQVYGENKAIFTVTGVYEDIPAKSWWHPAYLIPMLSYTALTGNKDYEENYWTYGFYTYVLLKPNTNPASVDIKIHDALKDYIKEHYPYLRPLSMVYLKPYFQNDLVIMIALFSFIAILLLLLSSINYINLQTANAITRFREIGIKKTLGFTKKRLWAQFMIESITLACIGGALGLVLAQLALPVFNRMIGEEFLTSIFTDWKMIIFILVVTLLTGFLSGIHPAYAISAFNPVAALKQRFVQEESNGLSLKKILVTAQFFISLFLLIISAIIFRQTQYMLTKEMGFESRKLLYANINTTKSGSFDALRQSLLRHPEIEDACQSDYIPFILPGGNDINWEGAEPEEKVFSRRSNISYEFISTFNLKITAGRNFSREFPSDNGKCLINESAVKVFGWDNAIGKHIRVNENDIEVIGVIRDYVTFSVHNPIEPHMYRLLPDSIQTDHVYSIRFASGNERKAKQIVQDEFEEFFPNDAFEFRNIQGLIQNENAVKEWTKIMKVCSSIALVSIIISSIGLFGLILFYTRRKMKEIGIRKVLGFSSVNLLYTLSSGFIRLLMASIVLAWPAAYYVYKVLPGADKYSIQIWEFLLATIIVFFVAQVTMSYQIIKAIRSKAVDVLKDE